MEIKEIVSYFVNKNTNILEVSFRTIDDSEDEVRNDTLDYEITIEYGYELESDMFDFFDDFEDDLSEGEDKQELDEEQLISFLNEYYMVNPKELPKPQIY